MISRVIRKLKFLSLQSGVSSYEDFKKLSPFRGIQPLILEKYKEKLRPHYERYIAEVSSADMAASLELATFIYSVCKLNNYTKVLDVGSGLSSFVFRLYASETPNVLVYSVDDDTAWLQKTKEFLSSSSLNTDHLYTLSDFSRLRESGFDCILHDLNFVEVRIKYIDEIVAAAKPGGIIILDDVHKPDYRFEVLSGFKKAASRIYSIEPVTRDSYGRYSFAIIKG